MVFERELYLNHLALNIAKRCNQRCVFCFEGDRRLWDELSIDRIRSMVSSSVKRGIKSLIFMWAETLLRKDILEIIKLVKLIGIKYVGVFTNGQVLSRDCYIEQLADAGLDYFDISFHYSNRDKFSRCTRTPPDNFDKLLKSIELLNNYNKKSKKDKCSD